MTKNEAKIKIRGTTAFICVDPMNYQSKVKEALEMLVAGREAFAAAGYESQTVRITTQPFPEYTRGMSRAEALTFLLEYDRFLVAKSKRIGIFIDPNIGPAMMRDDDDVASAELLMELLTHVVQLKSSIIVAGEHGIHWNTVLVASRLIKEVSERSARSHGTFNFAATAMLKPYAPFFPGSYHNGAGHQFTVGWQAAGIVEQAFGAANHDPARALHLLTEQLTEHGNVVERIAKELEKRTGWEYLGLDPTPAPLENVSIGAAIEKFTGAPFGSSGTMTAASIITKAVQSVPVKQVGYSGLMLPVLEDARIGQRWGERTCSLDSLMAYSAVCGTGLDTVPLPGEVTEAQLARIIGDIASLAVKWQKPLIARLQPAAGKRAGEKTDFGEPNEVDVVLQPLP